MEYEVELNVIASMYMEGWNGNAKNAHTFDFSDHDLNVLSEILTGHRPQDDVTDLLEEHLPDLFYDIYETAVETAQYKTIFEGTVEDLLQYLLEYQDIQPFDIIEADVKKSVFDPGTKDWRQLPIDDLVTRWCNQYREQLEHERYTVITEFFQREFNINCFFDNYIDLEIRLPRALYEEVKRRKEEQGERLL